ncbi:MAG: TfoX/Sxy family protein [Nitrospinota bacterium]
MAPDSLQEFIEDQLSGLRGLEFRPMFGGAGIYQDGVFFGALHKERLYFKTDETSRAEYEARGMGPFRPTPKQTLKNYYEVPVEIIEDAGALAAWARRAVACQEAKGKPRSRKPAARRKAPPGPKGPLRPKGRSARGR